MKLKDVLRSLAPRIIYIAHIKDKRITLDGENELLTTDIELTGKIANIIAAKVDGIGQLIRRGNQTVLSFAKSDANPIMGSRSAHLSGKEIVLTEMNEDGVITAHWDEIYLPNVTEDFTAPDSVKDVDPADEEDEDAEAAANTEETPPAKTEEKESDVDTEDEDTEEKPKRNV